MILYLGQSNTDGDFQPITIPDDYPVADVVALLPSLWWGTGSPVWVASDNAALATAASKKFGNAPVRPVPATTS